MTNILVKKRQNRKSSIAALGLALGLLTIPVTGQAQVGVRVVQSCQIDDIGKTMPDFVTVIWNPCRASQYGPLVSEFFYQHELGHVYLHTANEDAADCYAVQALRSTNPQAILAFIQFKQSQGWGGGDATHRPGIARAQFVYDCFRGAHGH